MYIRVDIGPFGNGRGMAVVQHLAHHGCLATWELMWVEEYPADKRRKEVRHEPERGSFHSDRATPEQQVAYETKFFEDLLGVEGVRAALLAAWEQVKPEHPADKEAPQPHDPQDG